MPSDCPSCGGTGRSVQELTCLRCNGSGSVPTPLADEQKSFPLGRAVFIAILVCFVIFAFARLHS